MTNQAAQALHCPDCTISWLQKNPTLNSVQLKAVSEQKQHVQKKDFNLKNPTNSLWSQEMYKDQILKQCVYSHTLKTESLKT